MSAKPLSMSLLKQLLHLRSQGCGIKEIARQTGNSRNTVRKLSAFSRFKWVSAGSVAGSAGFRTGSTANVYPTGPEQSIPGPGIKQGIFSQSPQGASRHLVAPVGRVPASSSFGLRLYPVRQWEMPHKAVVHLLHYPVEKLFIDFAGDKLSIVDPGTGELKEVEVLVAVLGYSQYTYVKAVVSQKLEDFLEACQNALRYFGGSPKVIIPDNLKAAVTKANRYEPQLNETFADLGLRLNLI